VSERTILFERIFLTNWNFKQTGIMSTNYQNNSADNSNNRAKKILPWAIAGLVALSGSQIATWVGYNNKKDEVQAAKIEIKKDEDLNVQLKQQFDDATAQLEGMKGTNQQLNALIDKQKSELSAQREKIGKLINVQKDLNSAKVEMARMKATTQGYVDQIARLETEKKQLGEQVTVLTTDKTNLQKNLTQVAAEKEQVITQKTAVEAEKAKVEQERTLLAKKTEIGSVVHISNVKTTGYHVRESGKEKERTHAGNIDRFKWCFDAIENHVTEGGQEIFYVRIIDPTGVAVSTTTGGGGVIKLADGKDIQYTTTKTVDFKNDTENVCMSWDAKGNANLVKGKYLIEIYNKGYLAGKSEFDLK